jgi:hypothetical protein
MSIRFVSGSRSSPLPVRPDPLDGRVGWLGDAPASKRDGLDLEVSGSKTEGGRHDIHRARGHGDPGRRSRRVQPLRATNSMAHRYSMRRSCPATDVPISREASTAALLARSGPP